MILAQSNRSFKGYVLELLKLNDKKHLHDQLLELEVPKFPLNRNILLEKGCPAGKRIEYVLGKLRDNWIDSNFTLQQYELIEQLPAVLEGYTEKQRTKSKPNKA